MGRKTLSTTLSKWLSLTWLKEKIIGKLFNGSMDYCTRATLFMDTLISRALASSGFMRVVAQIFETSMDYTPAIGAK